MDCVSEVPAMLGSDIRAATPLGLDKVVGREGDGGKGFPGSGFSDTGAGTYMVFRTSLRPLTVPPFRVGMPAARLLATLDSAAFLASGSSSATGSFWMLSLKICSASSPAASFWAWDIGSCDAAGTVNPSASFSGSLWLGGGPGGGGTSKMPVSAAVVPLIRDDELDFGGTSLAPSPPVPLVPLAPS